MNGYREIWMTRILERDVRIVDTQIMGSLQNGTAFFASTTLIAVGGTLTLLRSPDELLAMVSAPTGRPGAGPDAVGDQDGRADADLRLRLLQVRLVVPAVQLRRHHDRRHAAAYGTRHGGGQDHALRTARLFQSAGRHFNRGQRGFFFALGYLGWFVSPWLLMSTTAAVVIVMWRRQFASAASKRDQRLAL